MTPAELRELADKAEAEAVRLCGLSMGITPVNIGQAVQANRLFLMARNLRERARKIEYDAACERAASLENEDIPF